MEDHSKELNRIKAARSLLGWRQEKLAARAGISRQMIVRIERGDLGVSLRAMQKVRAALESGGIVFLMETERWEQAIALRKDAPEKD